MKATTTLKEAGTGRLFVNRWRRNRAACLALVLALVGLGACDKKLPGPIAHRAALPDPVVREGGLATIPINGLTFVIPEKTWLKGYHRLSTDGSVAGFTLHAQAPDVEPWSPERDAAMYRVTGWGSRIEVHVGSQKGTPIFKQTPEWVGKNWGCEFRPSTAFEGQNVMFCEAKLKKHYGYLEGNEFLYRLTCDSDEERESSKAFTTHPYCEIHFYYREALNIRLVFAERYADRAFEIARRIEAKMIEFDKSARPAGTTKGETK